MTDLNTITHPDSQVSALDRLAFTLLLALVVHFLIWAGWDMAWPVNEEQSKAKVISTLHVTLSQGPAEVVTEPVKHIAEQDQQGSGQTDLEQVPVQAATPPPVETKTTDKPLEKTPAEAPAKLKEVEPVQVAEVKSEQKSQPKPEPIPVARQEPLKANQPVKSSENVKAQQPPSVEAEINAQALLERSLEIARLEAEQQALVNQYAQRPKIRAISTQTAKASDDAFYLRQWQERIERMGNLNYPERARAEKLSGRLRVLVSLEPDGNLRDVRVLETSGHDVLDRAAINIVRLSAPFAPFPPSIRERTDILEIIRTWQFGDAN
ncbi:energy transducer TonB [Oceanospirillum beijerinckii]|uniref:energy transducer TonB n=1 Tax=Oceanospirillum beijerinckii TaxID=64976 RepID=UPI0003F58011|nr:energy transducer TonB [Oceanospirillum beijerinckii]